MNRETILVELVNILSQSSLIKNVFRQFKMLDTVSSKQFPCVFVEEDRPEVGFTWKSSGFADVTFQVSLMMAVRDVNAVSTALNNLDTEVKRIIATNPTINGTCVRATLEAEESRIGTDFAPYGMSVRPLTIMYEGSAANGF